MLLFLISYYYGIFLGKPVPEYEPVWFRKVMDKYTGDYCYMYNDEYWKCKQEQDWSRCPDIF